MTVNQLLTLLGVLAAIAAVCVTLLVWMDSQTHARMDRMDARMDRMEVRMDRMEVRMDRMDSNIGDLRTDVAKILAIIERGQSGGSTMATD